MHMVTNQRPAAAPACDTCCCCCCRVLQVIREATVRWAMIDQLQKPPAEFADVIKTHFKLRRPYILKQLDTWIEQAGDAAHKGRLQTLKGQLQTELNKLA